MEYIYGQNVRLIVPFSKNISIHYQNEGNALLEYAKWEDHTSAKFWAI